MCYYSSKIRPTHKKRITMTTSQSHVILMLMLIVMLFYFNGITGSALAQLSASVIATQPNNSSSNSNSKCSNPSIIDSNKIIRVHVLPPKFIMIYDGKAYQGQLSEAKFRGGETFSQLHIQPRNLTTNLPSKIVTVREGSCVQFAIIGTPRVLPPSSLGVTVYDSINGTAVKVLNVVGSHSAFRVNLAKGDYILLAVGTWLPRSEHVSGYAIYKLVVDVIS
jgi:hypothetical protein